MAWKYKCYKCGATLDAGEHCDCERERTHNDEGRQQAHVEEKITGKTFDMPVMR